MLDVAGLSLAHGATRDQKLATHRPDAQRGWRLRGSERPALRVRADCFQASVPRADRPRSGANVFSCAASTARLARRPRGSTTHDQGAAESAPPARCSAAAAKPAALEGTLSRDEARSFQDHDSAPERSTRPDRAGSSLRGGEASRRVPHASTTTGARPPGDSAARMSRQARRRRERVVHAPARRDQERPTGQCRTWRRPVNEHYRSGGLRPKTARACKTWTSLATKVQEDHALVRQQMDTSVRYRPHVRAPNDPPS
jgi:hypothetical protein